MKVNHAITILLLALSGCAHKSSTKDVLSSDYLLSKETKQLTFIGDNERPRFSPDGNRILYTSRNRGTHKGSQVYELDLSKNKERRVTFSDGDAFDPTYISATEFVYASTTDEIKENLWSKREAEGSENGKKFLPSELYMSDLFGSEILRLNTQPGYDAEPFFVPHENKPFILFTSRRGDLTGIYRLDLKNLPVTFVAVEKGIERFSPAISPDFRQIAWIEKDVASNEQSLVLFTLRGKIRLVLKKGEGEYRDLYWSPRLPNRLFYSVLRKGEKFYQIESLVLETGCTQVVFKGRDSLYFPTLSPASPERLAFVRQFQDKKQIYLVPLPQDLGPCIAAPTQATLKE